MITVTAAVMEKDGLILAARRKAGKHLAGYWEFPGGKVEGEETPENCLQRELQEEFGIHCSVDGFFAESIYDYGHKKVQLLGYFVTHLQGEFCCREHDSIVWLPPPELLTLQWAPADVPLMQQLYTTKMLLRKKQ